MPTDDLQAPVESNDLVAEFPEAALETLLTQVADKNQIAFRELYQHTSDRLFPVLLRLLKMRPLAEDALQETYVKIWNNANRYRKDRGAPLTWMTNIARNQALDILRKRRTKEDLKSEFFSQSSAGPDWSSTSYNAAQREVQPELYAPLVDSDDAELLSVCLEKLEDNQRQCIIKAYCEGYSHEELSTQTDSPLGTVKSWIRRGLMALRECVNELS